MEGSAPAVKCADNADVAAYLLKKRQELADSPKGIAENLDLTLSKAYREICNSKDPIKSIKDLSKIKFVGKWILRLMKGFFPEYCTNASPSKQKQASSRGKNTKGAKRYLPQKNSATYALLITLYRGLASGKSFMKKQELIYAAEISGLSRAAIGRDTEKEKPGQFGSSPRDWYTGWNCMKTLIVKGLVVRSSSPAKYMLTEEGQGAARECMARSGVGDSYKELIIEDLPHDFLDGPTHDGFVHGGSSSQERQAVLSDPINSDPLVRHDKDQSASMVPCTGLGGRKTINSSCSVDCSGLPPASAIQSSFAPHACSSSVCKDAPLCKASQIHASDVNFSAAPPIEVGERFEDVYHVILILDDRESFGGFGLRQVADSIRHRHETPVEVRRLPVGDGIWVARHKQLKKEYVLDFIVERKNVNDLCSSIRDNRYRDQKLRLQRCGLKKLIYLVEGDPNSLEAAESVKTACFTTEILEGFDVQRTTGRKDTVKKLGYLTKAISQYYSDYISDAKPKSSSICPTFHDFVRKCQDLEKITVSEVFALQLMQVKQVTEEVALAVIDLYPTLISLVQAFSELDGDVQAQQEMLNKKNPIINGRASKNIFNLVWGS